MIQRVLLLLILPVLGPPVAAADEAANQAEANKGETKHTAEALKFFESKIRPVLIEHCYPCHSRKEKESFGGLHVDTREALLRGGERGAAVVPGKPKESLLFAAISHGDPDLQMPPHESRLSESIIEDFERWIEQGAADPRTNEIPEEDRGPPGSDLWSYRPPAFHPTPDVGGDWCRTEVDRFVWSRLKENQLHPSSDAAPETLLRRLHFDLVGLPPTPGQITDFLEKVNTSGLEPALRSRVDELLASPEFGVRWGRHWLDVARFAESSGKEANISFPYAWRYRDYVIDAFNDDVPFDRFLAEQIAGDLLPAETDEERSRLLIATGFLALGTKNLDAANPRQFRADLVDEQIDTVTRVFMSSSVACARCHDHKFDPFSMEDYYALAGIFHSTKTFFGTAVSPSNRIGGDPLPLPRLDTTLVLHKSVPPKKIANLNSQMAALKKEKEDKGKSLTLRDALRIFWRTGAIEGQLEKYDSDGRALPLTMGVLDESEIIDVPRLRRGEVNRPAEMIPRAFPTAIEVDNAPSFGSSQSGRLELAQWLTDPAHPLTSRVAVNRIWSHLFGTGLVESVDDFGNTGAAPSHPALLDHLATKMVRNGWSFKQLIRELVLSRTYRQSSTFNEQAFRVDPENRWLWRMSKRRIEAESMRDAMLMVSGELDRRRPAGSLVGRVIGDRPISLVGLDKRLPGDLDGSVHRSIYLPVLRDRLPDVLRVFDFAEPSLVTGQREQTNVPTQSLYLMNSDFVRQRAVAMARDLRQTTADDATLIDSAFKLCYGRKPTEAEQTRIQDFLKVTNEKEKLQRTINACHALLSTAEFRMID